MDEPTTKKICLVSIKEYAEKYDITRNTVYRLIKEDKLKVYHCEHCELPHVDPEIVPTDVRKYEDRQEYPEDKIDTE